MLNFIVWTYFVTVHRFVRSFLFVLSVSLSRVWQRSLLGQRCSAEEPIIQYTWSSLVLLYMWSVCSCLLSDHWCAYLLLFCSVQCCSLAPCVLVSFLFGVSRSLSLWISRTSPFSSHHPACCSLLTAKACSSNCDSRFWSSCLIFLCLVWNKVFAAFATGFSIISWHNDLTKDGYRKFFGVERHSV